MIMPNGVNLAASNISDKETNKNKATEGKNPGSGNIFASFFSEENLKNTLENESKLGEKTSKLGQETKDKKKGDIKDLSGLISASNIPNFVVPEHEDVLVAGKDFGNRIESGNVMNQSDSLNSEKNLEKNFDFKNEIFSGTLLSSKKLGGFENLEAKKDIDYQGKIDIYSKLRDEKTLLNSNVKNPNIKKDLSDLYEIKEEDARNMGLKFKEQASKSGVLLAKELSPQSKGRVYIRNENDFLPNNIQKDAFNNSNVFESELRTVNNDLKLIGTSSYGFKKFNELERKEGEKSTLILNGTGQQDRINSNFNNYLEKVNDNYVFKNDFASIVDQVENGIKMNFNSQLKEMKIKLQPEELGEIDIKLKIDNNIMKAEFVVANHQVKEVLEGKFDMLRNNLAEKGFNPSEINVSVSTDSRNGNNSNKDNFKFENVKRTKNVRNSGSLLKDINNLEKQSIRRRDVKDDSSLDIFV